MRTRSWPNVHRWEQAPPIPWTVWLVNVRRNQLLLGEMVVIWGKLSDETMGEVQKYGVCEDVPCEKGLLGWKSRMTLDKISHHTVLDQCFVANLTVHLSLPSMKQIDWKHWGIPILPLIHPLSLHHLHPAENLTLKNGPRSNHLPNTDRGLADLGRLSKGETPWFQWPMGLHLYLRLGWSSFQVGKDGRNLGKVGSHRSFGKSDNRGAILLSENGLLFENATCKVCLLCFFLQAFDTVMSFLRLPGT